MQKQRKDPFQSTNNQLSIQELPFHPISNQMQLLVIESSSSQKQGSAGTRRKGTGISWTLDENRLYFEFMQKHEDLFGFSEKERQEVGIHNMMSEKIKTRTPVQCRSHHQKMLKKHKTIANILVFLKKELILEKSRNSFPILKMTASTKWRNELIDCDEFDKEEREEEISLWDIYLKEQTKNHTTS